MPAAQDSASPRVVPVEDDEGIARPLAAALRSSGYHVDHVRTGTEELRAVTADTAAVVLDLGLPDVDGVEVCRQLRRQRGADLAILVLTARTGETDVVVGLDATHPTGSTHPAGDRADRTFATQQGPPST